MYAFTPCTFLQTHILNITLSHISNMCHLVTQDFYIELRGTYFQKVSEFDVNFLTKKIKTYVTQESAYILYELTGTTAVSWLIKVSQVKTGGKLTLTRSFIQTEWKCQTASEGEGKVLTLLTIMLTCQLLVTPGLVIVATCLILSRVWYDNLCV